MQIDELMRQHSPCVLDVLAEKRIGLAEAVRKRQQLQAMLDAALAKQTAGPAVEGEKPGEKEMVERVLEKEKENENENENEKQDEKEDENENEKGREKEKEKEAESEQVKMVETEMSVEKETAAEKEVQVEKESVAEKASARKPGTPSRILPEGPKESDSGGGKIVAHYERLIQLHEESLNVLKLMLEEARQDRLGGRGVIFDDTSRAEDGNGSVSVPGDGDVEMTE